MNPKFADMKTAVEIVMVPMEKKGGADKSATDSGKSMRQMANKLMKEKGMDQLDPDEEIPAWVMKKLKAKGGNPSKKAAGKMTSGKLYE